MKPYMSNALIECQKLRHGINTLRPHQFFFSKFYFSNFFVNIFKTLGSIFLVNLSSKFSNLNCNKYKFI